MKLYAFVEWENNHRRVELVDRDIREPLFHEELTKIKMGWTILDVGGHIGYFSITAARAVGKNGRVFSFEPHPETHEVLMKNIKLHQLSNITTLQIALGDKKGFVNIFEGSDPGGHSIFPKRSLAHPSLLWPRIKKLYHVIRVRKFKGLKSVKVRRSSDMSVPLDTLDNIVNEYKIKGINLIKIDVEGAEFPVLKGGCNTLTIDKPILLVEIHPLAGRSLGYTPKDVFDFLEKFGYNMTTITTKGGKIMLVAR